MALIKCKECGSEVSFKAETCPKCGVKIKPKSIGCGGAILIIFIILVVVGALSSINRPPHSPQPQPTPAQKAQGAKEKRISTAQWACKDALMSILNDPDSAKLDDSDQWYSAEKKDGTIQIQPAGRAKNAFGAYIYGVWNCVAKMQGENARVISLTQINP
jgi:hypothetical protein